MERNTFLRKSRYGKLSLVVSEQKMRDDIACGYAKCGQCSGKKATYKIEECKEVYIPDDTFFETQIDMLHYCDYIRGVVCLQSVFNLLQSKNQRAYTELKEMIELGNRSFCYFANEHHKDTYRSGPKLRTIQYPREHLAALLEGAFKWYEAHLSACGVKVFLVTNMETMHIARESVLSTQQFIRRFTAAHPDMEEYASLKTCDKPILAEEAYKEYFPETELRAMINEGLLLTGRMSTNRLNPLKASIRLYDLDEEIFIIGEKNLNRALNFDTVAVEVLPEKEWISKKGLMKENEIDKDEVEKEHGEETAVDKKKSSLYERIKAQKDKYACARVVGVLKKSDKNYFCGSIDTTRKDVVKGAEDTTYIRTVVMPYDVRIPRIMILTKKFEELQDKRIIVAIDSWPKESQYPLGHFVRTIGKQEEVSVESEVILLEHGVEIRPFTKKVLDCLPGEGYTISSEELEGRRDCRSYPVCSIDPIGCKDIDDALHCRRLPNGNYEVGVHIADVSHYVKAETDLDKEAAKRCTTVYLVEKRTDMLPSLLTENLCSLVGKKDRLAFSVFWEFQETSSGFKILNTQYAKSVIRSVAALNYYEAQEMIEKGATGDKAGLVEGIRMMLKIARHLKETRNKRGALTLASTEVKFTLSSETHNPTDVTFYKTVDTHGLVEEFMLLANVAVAAKVYQHYPSYSVLRKHPTPKPDQINDLSETLKKFGYKLNAKDSLAFGTSLDKAVRPDDPFFNKLIRIMATRTMNQAVYFCTGDCDYKDFFHYGLAADIYTHFTSPIRRYADILVHRLLAASLDLESLSDQMTNRYFVAAECGQMNRKHRMAQFAGRASSVFHSYMLFKGKTTIEEAVIMQVSSEAIYAIVPRYGIEGMVGTTGFKVEFMPGEFAVQVNGKRISVFEHVMVEIIASTNDSRFNVRLEYRAMEVPKKEEAAKKMDTDE